MQPAYVSHKGGESVLIMKQSLWKNNFNFVKKYTHDVRKLRYNYSCREKNRHYVFTEVHIPTKLLE
jgi:hypothetical protein